MKQNSGENSIIDYIASVLSDIKRVTCQDMHSLCFIVRHSCIYFVKTAGRVTVSYSDISLGLRILKFVVEIPTGNLEY